MQMPGDEAGEGKWNYQEQKRPYNAFEAGDGGVTDCDEQDPDTCQGGGAPSEQTCPSHFALARIALPSLTPLYVFICHLVSRRDVYQLVVRMGVFDTPETCLDL